MRCRIFASTLLRTSIFGAGSLLLTPAVSAQEMNASGAAVGQVAQSGDEILVTARKTAERSQDVPITLNALSSDDLRNRAAVDVKDVLRSVPGVSFSQAERGQARYNIRGVSTSAFQPTVGIYLDDIALQTIATPFTGAFDPVFFDMERLEVLKGPQGTLYGGSAQGGAIKYISARPNLTRASVSGTVRAETTRHGDPSYGGEAVVNLPLIEDQLAVRAGVYYRRDGGYTDNIAGGLFYDARYSTTDLPVYTPEVIPTTSTRSEKNQNYGDTVAARLSLEWQPDPSWSIRPQIFYQYYKLQNPGQFWLQNADTMGVGFRIKQPTRDVGTIYSLNVDKDLDFATVTSLTAYFDRDLSFTRDYTYFIGGLIPVLRTFGFRNLPTRNVSPNRVKTFSQELRIQSNGGPDAPLNWLIGFYYQHQKDRAAQTLNTEGANAVPVVGGFFGPDGESFDGRIVANTNQYAVFGETTYRITDALALTGGVRVFKSKQTTTGAFSGFLNAPVPTSFSNRLSDDGVNPKVGASYKLSSDNLVYASASKGFRPGGTNRAFFDPATCQASLNALGLTDTPRTYKSDSLWQYELGTKNSFGRAMFNASAFFTDWKNIQQLNILSSCGQFYTTNAGTARLKGVEGEGRFNITDAWQLGGNAAYVDSEIRRPNSGTTAQVGDELPYVPKWTASAYTSYTLPLSAEIEALFRVDYQYQGKARMDFNRTTFVTSLPSGVRGEVPNFGEFRKSFDVVNAFVSVGDGETNVRLYVNNLFDSRPFIDKTTTTGEFRVTTIRPRTVGIELHREF